MAPFALFRITPARTCILGFAPLATPTPTPSMSSRGGGPRTTGTDGSDHAFRQTVDTKYKKAAVARKNLKKTLTMLFAYYPVACGFALGPAVAMGKDLDVHNVPFALLALFGLVFTIAATSAAGPKSFDAKKLTSSTKFLALIGVANLAAATAARFLVFEDRRIAWVFSEFLSDKVGKKTLQPGQMYPFAVSLELLLEIVGVIIPMGAVALVHALATYSGASSKTN